MLNLNHLILAVCLAASPTIASSNMQIDTLLSEYQQLAAKPFNAKTGEALWLQTFKSQRSPESRSCTSCHTSNPINSGKHVRTNKTIDPIAQSVSADRFSDIKKIRKWLKRNCKWTLGRECTAQEKGDVLSYLKDL